MNPSPAMSLQRLISLSVNGPLERTTAKNSKSSISKGQFTSSEGDVARFLNDALQWRIQDFPKEGANPQGGIANLLFGQKFPENCIKMKEFEPRGGGGRPWRSLRSANALNEQHKSVSPSSGVNCA